MYLAVLSLLVISTLNILWKKNGMKQTGDATQDIDKYLISVSPLHEKTDQLLGKFSNCQEVLKMVTIGTRILQ
jgi:hypothetical protein